MKLRELQAGDLLFMYDVSEMSQAIKDSTGQYSHVGIFFEQMIYHATRNQGVVKQSLREFLDTHEQLVSVYRYPKIDPDQVLQLQRIFLVDLIMIVFILIMIVIIVQSILQKSYRFLKLFL